MDCMYNSVFGPLHLLMVDLLMYSDLVYLVLVSLVCICLCFPVWTLKANWANISKNYRWLFICSFVIKYPPHFSASIKVDLAPISFKSSILAIDKNGIGGTKIGTLTPYTVLHSAIFRPLVNEFTKKAMDRKIKKASPVAPFGVCFDAKMVRSGKAGPDVPAIVLVLQGNVQWRMEGANSMVRVSKDVMCLGFVDGGSKPRTAVVIGAHQMEDNLVEFDVGSSTFGFSNSLLLQNSSCSSRS